MMTPGIAKSRQELFWLPYPEPDRVIINAHNFTPAGPDFSVNGKTPISVWCPSLDDVGNGTTTLTDLVGSNDGTLTNMDAATDWVTDTDAGGIRALDFDATSERVAVGNQASLDAVSSLSAWFYSRNTNHAIIASKGDYNVNRNGYVLVTTTRVTIYLSSASAFQGLSDPSTYTLNTWHHAVATWDGTTVKLYVDGALVNSAAQTVTPAPSSKSFNIGGETDWGGAYRNGRIDDVRAFSDVIDATDVAFLWNSGTGRGISA